MNKFKYTTIKNFLSEDELNLLATYCKMRHRTNFEHFSPQVPNQDSGFYADYLMESILINKQGFLEKEIGLKLLPTYSYWRCYTKFSNLPPHTDRPSCEYSVTVMIDSDKTDWPIVIEDKSFLLDKGDALIYKGCEYIHERDEFKGDYHIQAFLHYVNRNGENKEWFKEKRKTFGLQKI